MNTGSLRALKRPLEEIAEKPLAQLHAYWREAARGRACLPNSELRPERSASALQHIAVIERIASPRAGLRVRLCGSDIENKDFGIARGAFIEDARPAWYRDHLKAEFAAVLARSEPVYQHVEAELDTQRFGFSRLILPMSSDGKSCDMLLVAAIRPSDSIVSASRARLSLA